jgi:hypothetical protein
LYIRYIYITKGKSDHIFLQSTFYIFDKITSILSENIAKWVY